MFALARKCLPAVCRSCAITQIGWAGTFQERLGHRKPPDLLELRHKLPVKASMFLLLTGPTAGSREVLIMQGYDKDEEADRNLAYIGGSEIKRHYELNMERKLQSLGANIDQWSGQAEIMAVEKMKELRRKQAEASKRLEELKA